MRFPVFVPGMEGQRVEVATNQLTGGIAVTVNGMPAQKGPKRGDFYVNRPDGSFALIQFTPRLALDNAVRITVDGVPQVLGTPLRPAEMVLVWLPLILMFVGGAIGGICAGLAIAVNLGLFRSNIQTWLKYVCAVSMAAGSFMLYLAIAIPIYHAMHPQAAQPTTPGPGGFTAPPPMPGPPPGFPAFPSRQ